MNNYFRENEVREINFRELKSGKNIGQFHFRISGISGLQLVDNCVKIGGNIE